MSSVYVNSPAFIYLSSRPYVRAKEVKDFVTFSRKILITGMFRKVREQVGDVNILVNNAGIMVRSLKMCFTWDCP